MILEFSMWLMGVICICCSSGIDFYRIAGTRDIRKSSYIVDTIHPRLINQFPSRQNVISIRNPGAV